MRRRPYTIVLIPLVAIAAAAMAQDEAARLSPEQVGQIFCISRLGNDMKPALSLVSEDLYGAIDEAEYRNSEIEAANPGDKPPLGDGIPWQSAPDYAPVCTVGEVLYMMDEADVQIRYAFPDYPDAGFTDKLRLKLLDDPIAQARVWRIDNVIYAADGDLRTSLVMAFMEN